MPIFDSRHFRRLLAGKHLKVKMFQVGKFVIIENNRRFEMRRKVKFYRKILRIYKRKSQLKKLEFNNGRSR